MSVYFDRLAQSMKLKKEAPPPADTSSLGAAIEQLIDTAVEESIADALEKQKPYQNPRVPPHLREFTDKPFSDTYPPAPPTTAPPRDFTMDIQRDELGRIKTFTVGSDAKFELQRNGEGKTVRVVKLD